MVAQFKSAERMGISRSDLVNASSGLRMMVRKVSYQPGGLSRQGPPEKVTS
jgi:hypothetical protein